MCSGAGPSAVKPEGSSASGDRALDGGVLRHRPADPGRVELPGRVPDSVRPVELPLEKPAFFELVAGDGIAARSFRPSGWRRLERPAENDDKSKEPESKNQTAAERLHGNPVRFSSRRAV